MGSTPAMREMAVGSKSDFDPFIRNTTAALFVFLLYECYDKTSFYPPDII